MSYKDKFGITDIKTGVRNNLAISWDTDEEGGKIPVLLFTPSMEDVTDHFHIEITKEEAKILKEWLDLYLEDL